MEEGKGEALVRRSAPDENDLLVQVSYTPTDHSTWARKVELVKLQRRSKAAEDAIKGRKAWTRFGAAKGATGKERGVSMVAHDKVLLEDPLSEDANKTGEERLIERLKATVKNKSTTREQDAAGYDFDKYVPPAKESGRASSNTRYQQSPNRYRPPAGPSPGRFPSPSRNYRGNNNNNNSSSSSSSNAFPGSQGRNSPGFMSRPGHSNPRGRRSPNPNWATKE